MSVNPLIGPFLRPNGRKCVSTTHSKLHAAKVLQRRARYFSTKQNQKQYFINHSSTNERKCDSAPALSSKFGTPTISTTNTRIKTQSAQRLDQVGYQICYFPARQKQKRHRCPPPPAVKRATYVIGPHQTPKLG